MLFPAGDPQYYALRPRLALAPDTGSPFSQDARLRWHPAASGLATLHAEGKLSVLPAVGYDHSDKSHFTSRHYWEVGATDAALRTGWIGRYLDQVGTADNPLQGLSLDARLQPALATARVPIASLEAVDRFTFTPPGIVPHHSRRICTGFQYRWGGLYGQDQLESAAYSLIRARSVSDGAGRTRRSR